MEEVHLSHSQQDSMLRPYGTEEDSLLKPSSSVDVLVNSNSNPRRAFQGNFGEQLDDMNHDMSSTNLAPATGPQRCCPNGAGCWNLLAFVLVPFATVFVALLVLYGKPLLEYSGLIVSSVRVLLALIGLPLSLCCKREQRHDIGLAGVLPENDNAESINGSGQAAILQRAESESTENARTLRLVMAIITGYVVFFWNVAVAIQLYDRSWRGRHFWGYALNCLTVFVIPVLLLLNYRTYLWTRTSFRIYFILEMYAHVLAFAQDLVSWGYFDAQLLEMILRTTAMAFHLSAAFWFADSACKPPETWLTKKCCQIERETDSQEAMQFASVNIAFGALVFFCAATPVFVVLVSSGVHGPGPVVPVNVTQPNTFPFLVVNSLSIVDYSSWAVQVFYHLATCFALVYLVRNTKVQHTALAQPWTGAFSTALIVVGSTWVMQWMNASSFDWMFIVLQVLRQLWQVLELLFFFLFYGYRNYLVIFPDNNGQSEDGSADNTEHQRLVNRRNYDAHAHVEQNGRKRKRWNALLIFVFLANLLLGLALLLAALANPLDFSAPLLLPVKLSHCVLFSMLYIDFIYSRRIVITI